MLLTTGQEGGMVQQELWQSDEEQEGRWGEAGGSRGDQEKGGWRGEKDKGSSSITSSRTVSGSSDEAVEVVGDLRGAERGAGIAAGGRWEQDVGVGEERLAMVGHEIREVWAHNLREEFQSICR